MPRPIIWRKKERQQIHDVFVDVLSNFGTLDRDRPLKLKTRYGELRCDFSVSESFLHIYLQFMDQIPNDSDLPTEWPGQLNKWSGKWNFWSVPHAENDRTKNPRWVAKLLQSTLTELVV